MKRLALYKCINGVVARLKLVKSLYSTIVEATIAKTSSIFCFWEKVSSHLVIRLLIKRIIAIPGQTFNYVGDKLYINGVESEDKYGIPKMDGLSLKDVCAINGMYEECLQEDGSFKLPEGWYVVLGDNRQYSSSNIPVSIDSRSFGLVHESQIYGKVIYEVESLFNWSKIE